MERGESKARERPIRFEEMSAFLYSSCMISFPTRNKENSFRSRLVVCRRRDASSSKALRYLPLSNLSPTWISPRCSVNIVFSRSDDPADVRAPLVLSRSFVVSLHCVRDQFNPRRPPGRTPPSSSIPVLASLLLSSLPNISRCLRFSAGERWVSV